MLKTSPVPVREIMPEAERRQQALGASGAAVETTPKRTRRSFSAAEKLRIVKKADACIASGERGRARGDAAAREAPLQLRSVVMARAARAHKRARGTPRRARCARAASPSWTRRTASNAAVAQAHPPVLERKLHIAEAVVLHFQKKSARDPGHFASCISSARRRDLMDLVEDLADPIVPIGMACLGVGVSRATLYRGTRPAPPRCLLPRACRAHVASKRRRARRDSSPRSTARKFVDQSVMEVYATLLSRGVYLASISHDLPLDPRRSRRDRRSGRQSAAAFPRVHRNPR